MILVNNPGTWGDIYAPFKHAAWNGLTPTDLIFPFFLFIMGVSLYISLEKQEFRFSKALALKIAKRALILLLIGVLLNASSLFMHTLNQPIEWSERMAKLAELPEHVRLMGVFQRLALAYLFGALLVLLIPERRIVWIAALLLVLYGLILLMGNGLEFSTDNILAAADRALLGESHMYSDWLPNGDRIKFDPEGVLGIISSVAQLLLGFKVGSYIRNNKGNLPQTMVKLAVYGITLLFIGMLLTDLIPFNKKIWSPTFVLATSGFATLALTLLIYLIDVKGKKSWTPFFVTFGVNPLTIYIFAYALAILIDTVPLGEMGALKPLCYDTLLGIFVIPKLASLLFALLFVGVNWGVCRWMWNRGIILKL